MVTVHERATQLDVAGARIRVLDTGGPGEPVLLLHSAVGDADIWQHQLVSLSSAGLRAIAFDRPGHGLSTGTWTVGEAVATGEVADALGLGRYHLVGVAQGARIANEVALADPARLLSLTLAASTAGVALGPAGDLPMVPKSFLTMAEVWFRELGPSYRAIDPEGVRRWLALVSRTSATHHAQAGPKPGKVDAAALGGLDLRVLVIGGDADPYAPPPLLRKLCAVYRAAELVVLTECGHSPQWERPTAFDEALLRHLRA